MNKYWINNKDESSVKRELLFRHRDECFFQGRRRGGSALTSHRLQLLLIPHSEIFAFGQSINQSMDPWINEWINQSINRSIGQWIHGSMNEWMNESMNQSINQSINEWMNRSINQSTPPRDNYSCWYLAYNVHSLFRISVGAFHTGWRESGAPLMALPVFEFCHTFKLTSNVFYMITSVLLIYRLQFDVICKTFVCAYVRNKVDCFNEKEMFLKFFACDHTT